MALGLRHRPWLTAAALTMAVGTLAGWLVLRLPLPEAPLLGWCQGVALWLVMTVRVMLRSSPEAMRHRAERLDEGKWAVLGASLGAAIASLVAVVWAMAAGGPATPGFVALGLVTITLSWGFVHVLFATHYAHDYWLAGRGIVFPGTEKPDFLEFLYFAFTIGMTFQVSDVTTEAPAMRRLVLLHAAIAFLFNAVILAAAVNLAAGLAH